MLAPVIQAEPKEAGSYLPHTDTPFDVRAAAESLGAHATRIRRWLGQPSTTGATRRSAADELDALISEALDLRCKLFEEGLTR